MASPDLTLPHVCSLISYGNNIVALIDESYRDIVSKYIDTFPVEHCFETPNMHILNDEFQKYGYRVCFMSEYFRPNPDTLKELPCIYPLRVLKNDDFSLVTACGECCVDCEKKAKGICPGCIEADGYVPEWSQSGRCTIHACTREHDVPFCGLCKSFPCEKLPQIVSWNTDIVEHMYRLRDVYRETQ